MQRKKVRKGRNLQQPSHLHDAQRQHRIHMCYSTLPIMRVGLPGSASVRSLFYRLTLQSV